MNEVRLGIIGVGGMGALHADYIRNGAIKGAKLTAVCDVNEQLLAGFEDVNTYRDSSDLTRSGDVDAVLIATPHYFHTAAGIDALEQGLHLLVEKPISVQISDCERLIAAHTNEKQVFAAMFNMRTDPRYQKVRRLIRSGELGEITRVNWIVTNWFRTEAYYASSNWRATWRGEGGGVLLNQCPHCLDVLQWLLGMPSKIRGFCGFGVRHKIEVEDQVTAYMEFSNGATGVFVTTTGEHPGTDRLEIAGDRGKIVIEDGKVSFTRNEVPISEYSASTNVAFGAIDVWDVNIPADGCGGQHQEVTQNFIDAILEGVPLIAPAQEGIHSVMLANAIIYSSLKDKTVEMPLSGAEYEQLLNELIADSKFMKTVMQNVKADIASSFRK